jgi:hypothetical protein
LGLLEFAHCVNIKPICTLLCKTDSDFVSSVLQCEYACKVQDALAQILKIFEKFGSLLESTCEKGDMNQVPYPLEVPEA